jgi:uncharacterized protein (TIGR02145 family)
MKKIFAALGIVTFAVVGCDDSSSASSNDDPGVESSSSEAVFSSSSSEQFFVPSEYRTCDKKYEGKFLLYQYRETLDAWYGTYRVNTVFYKCENGKWSGPSATSPENLTEGDVIRAAPDDWECDAENEGQVQSWSYMVFAVPHSPMGYTPTYYARCEQGDWVLCEPESSSSSSMDNASSNSVKSSSSETSVSSSGVVESSSSVEESSSSEVTPQSSSSSTNESSSSADVQSSSSETESSSSSSEVKLSSSSDGFDWNLPKEAYLNPDIDYGTVTDERDGKVYKTVKIGEQIWMAENLNFDPGQGGSGDAKYEWSWCYDNEPRNCDVAGRLYTWAAAIDSVKLANDVDNPQDCGYGTECGFTGSVQGICLNGWHLPSEDEWWSLVVAVDADITEFSNTNAAGKALKSQSGWRSRGNGTDAFGFSALPAGIRYYNGTFKHEGDYAHFWSSSGNTSYAYYMYLRYDCKFAGMNDNFKYYAKSVRCLKD